MTHRTAIRLGMVLALVFASAGVNADEAFNPAVVVSEAEVLAHQLSHSVTSVRKWQTILRPAALEDSVLQDSAERKTAIHLLASRPPLAALESTPINIQVCALYAQKRARLFRHYRSLMDLTDLGDRRIVRQLSSWLYRSARDEGPDFVVVWCDDLLSERGDEPQVRGIVASALAMVAELLEEDGGDALMLGELQDYLRRI